nr:hypothetical protein [Tanacetum cinerariifolium]
MGLFKIAKVAMGRERQTVKDQDTCSQNHNVPKRDWTGLIPKRRGLGYGYTRKACFVLGSFSHLIRDCAFHEKRVAKQVKLNKSKNKDNPHQTLKGKSIVDSGFSRYMTGNKAYLVEYQDFICGPISFGGSKGKIIGKGKIRIGKLDFEDMYFVKELQHFNLFSVSQMCDKKNKVLFTNTECLVLSHDFKLLDENQVLLRVPRQNNMYSFNLENIVPSGGLACLIAKAIVDESNKWYRRVLVTKPQNKTPYELITGKIPIISYIRPFGCHVTILNTIGYLGKFEEKSDEGFLFKYSLNSKAFRVYNLGTKKVEENLHINFLENKPNVIGKGPTWFFDLDYLTDSMNYQPVTAENKANKTAGPNEANNSTGTQDTIHVGNSEIEAEHVQEYCVLPLWSSYTSTVKSSEAKNRDEKLIGHTGSKTNEEPLDQAFLEELESLKQQAKEADDAAETLRKTFAKCIENLLLQAGATGASSTNYINTASTPVNTTSTPVNTASTPVNTASPLRNVSAAGPSYPDLSTFANQDDSQIPSLEDMYEVPNDRIFISASYDDEGAVADFKNLESTMNVSPIPQSRIHSIHPTTQILGDPTSTVQTRSKVNKSLRARAFIKPKKISQALKDESWVDAMHEELLQFKTRHVWILVDLPFRKKARLVAYGHRQEEEIDYDEVFAPMAMIQAIRIFLAFASYMRFIVYQMDVKSAFLYGKIDEEVYVSKPPSFIDSKFPKKVYKVIKALYGLHQAPRACYATLSTILVQSRYRRGLIDKTLFIKKDKKDIMLVKKKEDRIFISQDKYVAEFLKNFDFMSVKNASTPIETKKHLVKDAEAVDVDVTSTSSHLPAVKRIFKYLKGQTALGLWYPRESTFDLEAYSDSDYAGANLDRKSTTGEAEYVATASCCRQVLWIQNQMLDYGFNFMNTKIYIDNESTICIVKNPVFHSKTNHIENRYHFIRDTYEKKLIQTEGNAQFHRIVEFLSRIHPFRSGFSKNERFRKGVSAAGETLSTATLAVSTATLAVSTISI